MLSRYRHLFGVLFFLLIASCSGSGCSGCSGCAGMTPLPGGFPPGRTVENAATVRLSRPGLDFFEKELSNIAVQVTNAPEGKLPVSIPETAINVPNAFSVGICPVCLGFDVVGSVCPGGPDPNADPPRCAAEVNLQTTTFQVDAIMPNAVRVAAVVPLQLDDTPVSIDINPGPALTVHVGYGAGGRCVGASSEKPTVTPKALPIKVTIPFIAETTDPRIGYTKVDVDNAVVDLSGLVGGDVQICADCGPLSFSAPIVGNVNLCNPVLNAGFIKNTLVDQLKKGLEGQVKSILKDQLCTHPNPTLNPSCPTGTSPDTAGTKCVYDSDKAKCVPTLFGTDAHVDLGGFLKSISPGTAGGVDFGLASFGRMNPAPSLGDNAQGRSPNGITLGLVGGVVPQPPSKCITPKVIEPPTGIPTPDELAPNLSDPPGTPQVGIALAGRFLEYAFTNVYNSGFFCLGVSTEQVDLLKSGLVSFLIPSIKTLTFEQSDAAVAIGTRPGEPPRVKLGGGTNLDTDPLLLVSLPKLALDFYVWSNNRFVRVFTYTGNLDIPVNLQTAKGPTNPNGGIVPAIGTIKVANGAVTNADTLLLEEPAVVSGAVASLFGTVSKQLVGSGFTPIDLSGSLARFGIVLGVDRIKKLTKGTDDYVGIFATMTKKPTAATAEAETSARLVGKQVWNDHLTLGTYDREKRPRLDVEASSSLDDGVHAIEYSWWIDAGTRSPWSTDRHLSIQDDQLLFQGKHVLHVTSRIVDDAASEDSTPADVPYVIDALPPFVTLEHQGGEARLRTWDVVSSEASLVARYRLGDAPFTEWAPATSLGKLQVGDAASLEVEVSDEEGNIGVVRQELRGRADPSVVAAGSGCGCRAAAQSDHGGLVAALVGLVALGLVALRRRARVERATIARSGLAIVSLGIVAATSQGCGCGAEDAPGAGCGADCNQACQVGLGVGQPGSYLSVAKAADGTIWAAGYNDSLLREGDALLFGDLVVGTYDLGKKEVAWETVDGIPTRTDGTCPAYERDGFRNGETDSGDDVGRFTSLQLSPSGDPIVTYYDDTHKRLKLAVKDGARWKISVLAEKPGADIGMFGKMLIVDGKPVIVYLHLEPGNAGRMRSKIVLARARTERPQGAGDFDFDDIAVDEESPCRANSCATGEACVKATGTCTKTVTGCQPACSDSQACVAENAKATCKPRMGTVETYPRALGAFLSLAKGPDGLGLVAYDGYRGNLVAFADRGKLPWERVIVDGETGRREDKTAIDTGDVGIGASLVFGSDGTWHISYVNGLDESLRYATITGGRVGKSQIVDDGSSADGKPFPDGKHVVGDDSAIRIDGDVVTIHYADSTSLGLRKAVSPRSATPRTWELESVPQEGRWVAFPQYVPGEDERRVAVWWRKSDRATKTVEANVLVLP